MLADHHAFTASVISGYHVAFITGAAAIAVGIVLAFALLKPTDTRPGLQLAADADTAHPRAHLDLEQQAA
jgi:hypothetical protein